MNIVLLFLHLLTVVMVIWISYDTYAFRREWRSERRRAMKRIDP